MLRLHQTLNSWPGPDFKPSLKNELEALGAKNLPLSAGTTQGGYVGQDPICVTVNAFIETHEALVGSVGVFFTEIVINCGCGVEPMPVNAYCQLDICIDKKMATLYMTARPD